MTLRHATGADADALAAFGARAFHDTFAADNDPADMALYLAEAFAPHAVAAEIADPAATTLLAERGGALVGYVRLVADCPHAAVTARRTAELSRLYAGRAALGTGVGARLMEACLDEAARTGHDAVWLGVWERNARAIAFYERWGFAVVAETTFTVGTDVQRDVVMARVTPVRAGPPRRA